MDVPCRNKVWDDYGKIVNDNVVGNGICKTNNGVVHKYICNMCSKNFTSNANTVLHDLK
jgi:hypothetical protein